MGNFYCNFTTYGPDRSDVLTVLNTHILSAYVSPTRKGHTLIYEQSSDDLDETAIDRVGRLLSRELSCPVLAAVVADDDELWLCVYQDDQRSCEYSSRSRYTIASAICRVFKRPWMIPFVWLIMQLPYMVIESLRHALLARLLGIPASWAICGYRYIEEDEPPGGLTGADLAHTPNKPDEE